ncbi:C-type lectin Cal-like [Watersipora subatra]|uniref:C-type lectin Cal-like n=1 Tax=Watersipora subatra TaxID=2589382 RepID=UPI00355AF28D
MVFSVLDDVTTSYSTPDYHGASLYNTKFSEDMVNTEGSKAHSTSKRDVISPINFQDVPYGNICQVCQPEKPKAVECPGNYIRNPYSNTCIRLVTIAKTWQDAYNHCFVSGENLATFETLESAFWLINLRKLNNAWKDNHLWIGGRRRGVNWQWEGKTKAPIDTLVWANNEPSFRATGEECIGSWTDDNYKFNDFPCGDNFNFICEKSM